jgi:hypothetical protein
LLVDNKTSADRPQPDSPADSLRDWLAYVNGRSSAPVACHPGPDEFSPEDRVYYYRPGELVVRHDKPEVLDAVLAALDALGVIVADREPARMLPVSLLQLAPGSPPVPELLDRLREEFPDLQGVVSPNYVAFPAVVLNGAPWVNGGPGGAPASVVAPYDEPAVTPRSGAGAKMFVLDTGLLEKPATRPWMVGVRGPAEPATSPTDLYARHGLFVAGVAAGAIPDGYVLVVDAFNNCLEVEDFKLGQLFVKKLRERPDVPVLSLSGGTYAPPTAVPQTLTAAIQANPGVLFVVAAGNLPAGAPSAPYFPAASGTPEFPGAPPDCPNVVGVGATDAQGTPAAFSNADPRSAQVWAHGAGVVNAFKPGTVSLPPLPDVVIAPNQQGTASWGGTSFATPLVAGMMARYMAATGGPADRLAAVQWLTDQGWVTTTGGITVITLP